MDREALIVDGFELPSYQEAEIARKEQQNIAIIRERTSLSDGAAVYELYVKLIERNMFKTMIGYSYLYDLRYRLVNEFGYDGAELPIVRIPKQMEYDRVRMINEGVLQTKLDTLMNTKKKMTIAIVALTFMIIGMFVIAIINPNVGYVNTENKVINKYSAWEEELTKREEAVKEKEQQLNMDSQE